jgi:hypothetical protein
MEQEQLGCLQSWLKSVDAKSRYGAYHRIMTPPAISRPRNAGTNIGGTSHSRKIEFLDRHTDRLFLWQEFKLSVTDRRQRLDSDGPQQILFPPRLPERVSVGPQDTSILKAALSTISKRA